MAESCLLYYITDRTAFAADETTRRKSLLGKMSEAARAGIDYIQLREKDLSGRELESLAQEAVALLTELRNEHHELRTRLLINSRSDVALVTGADGVHLRSDDIPHQEVRAIWKKCGETTRTARAAARELSPQSPIIGMSCHSPERVVQAEADGATFAVFAPVFEKKDSPTAPRGLSLLREACRARIPVLALGGVTLANADSCFESGAAGIAGIRLFQENKVAEIVKSLRGR